MTDFPPSKALPRPPDQAASPSAPPAASAPTQSPPDDAIERHPPRRSRSAFHFAAAATSGSLSRPTHGAPRPAAAAAVAAPASVEVDADALAAALAAVLGARLRRSEPSAGSQTAAQPAPIPPGEASEGLPGGVRGNRPEGALGKPSGGAVGSPSGGATLGDAPDAPTQRPPARRSRSTFNFARATTSGSLSRPAATARPVAPAAPARASVEVDVVDSDAVDAALIGTLGAYLVVSHNAAAAGNAEGLARLAQLGPLVEMLTARQRRELAALLQVVGFGSDAASTPALPPMPVTVHALRELFAEIRARPPGHPGLTPEDIEGFGPAVMTEAPKLLLARALTARAATGASDSGLEFFDQPEHAPTLRDIHAQLRPWVLAEGAAAVAAALQAGLEQGVWRTEAQRRVGSLMAELSFRLPEGQARQSLVNLVQQAWEDPLE